MGLAPLALTGNIMDRKVDGKAYRFSLLGLIGKFPLRATSPEKRRRPLLGLLLLFCLGIAFLETPDKDLPLSSLRPSPPLWSHR